MSGLTHCDQRQGHTDFVCQLRRHSLHAYGQHRGGVLSSDRAQAQGAAARPRPAADALRRAAATAVPPDWTGDDWVGEVTLLPATAPRALQTLLTMPRCVGTANLFVYFLLNGVLVLLLTRVVRLALAAAAPDFAAGVPQVHRPVRNWLASRQQMLVVTPAVCLGAALLQPALLHVIGRWVPWVEAPPTLLTVAMVLYGFVLHALTDATGFWEAAVLRNTAGGGR